MVATDREDSVIMFCQLGKSGYGFYGSLKIVDQEKAITHHGGKARESKQRTHNGISTWQMEEL